MAVFFNDVSHGLVNRLSHAFTFLLLSFIEKEQQRLCKIQRDDDAVTSQAPQEPTTPNAGDALRKTPSYHQSMIWIDQFCRFLLLRIIYEQAVTRSVKTENQDAFQRLLPFDIGKSLFPKGVWFCYPLFVQV
ncbi:unnamed protein product [Brassica rapa subsp. narinosa]